MARGGALSLTHFGNCIKLNLIFGLIAQIEFAVDKVHGIEFFVRLTARTELNFFLTKTIFPLPVYVKQLCL